MFNTNFSQLKMHIFLINKQMIVMTGITIVTNNLQLPINQPVTTLKQLVNQPGRKPSNSY